MARQAEVGHLDAAAITYEQVRRLQVPMEHTPSVERLNASTGVLHRTQRVSDRCRHTSEHLGNASLRQVLHPNNGNAGLDIGGVNAHDVLVLSIQHRLRLGEDWRRRQSQRIEVLRRTLSIQCLVFLQPDLAEESRAETHDLAVRHRLRRKEGSSRDDGLPSCRCDSTDDGNRFKRRHECGICLGLER